MNADLQAVMRRRIALPFLRRFSPVRSVEANGRRVFADLRDSIIGRTLFLEGRYEQALNDVIVGLRPHLTGHCALDIGANIGLHTLALSESVGPTGRVLAFEPESHNADLLERTLADARAGNVTVRREAVGDRAGLAAIHRNPSNFGDHRVAGASGSDVTNVPMTTIDLASSAESLTEGSIRFAKMDVQGYELNVIRGMLRTLEQNPDIILAVEVYPAGLRAAGGSAVELMREFRRAGFNGWELHPERVIPLADPETYGLLRGDGYVDVVLSRATDPLASVLRRLYETERPAAV